MSVRRPSDNDVLYTTGVTHTCRRNVINCGREYSYLLICTPVQ